MNWIKKLFGRKKTPAPYKVKAKPYKVRVRVTTGDKAQDDLNLANELYNQGEFEQALPVFEDALAKSQRDGNPRLEAAIRSRLASLLADLGSLDEAFLQAQEALSLAREQEEKESEINTLQLLGALYRGRRRLAEAMNYYEESVKLARAVRKSSTIELKALKLNGLTNLASLHLQKNEIEEASKLIKKGRSLAGEVEAFWRKAMRAVQETGESDLVKAYWQDEAVASEMSGQAGVMARRAGMYHVTACDVLARMGNTRDAIGEAELALEIGKGDGDTFLIDIANQQLSRLR